MRASHHAVVACDVERRREVDLHERFAGLLGLHGLRGVGVDIVGVARGLALDGAPVAFRIELIRGSRACGVLSGQMVLTAA